MNDSWIFHTFECKNQGKIPITAPLIQSIQSWLRRSFKVESTLVVTREGDKNRVCLRMPFEGAIREIEAAVLNEYRRKKLPLDQVRQMIGNHNVG